MNTRTERWPPEAEEFWEDMEKLVEHVQYAEQKRKLQTFVQKSWKQTETETIDRFIARREYERASELQGATPNYKPGHIGPIVYEHLNMAAVERAFVSGLQHTKSSMVKTIQQRVNDINTLLRGVGGFNRQLHAGFSRSAVVYLEHTDPERTHREKVVFSINLADFELRYTLTETAENTYCDDGRSARRHAWDYAVNVLSEIVSNTGLKPKYVKNDKHTCRLVMSQALLHSEDSMPDEYFRFHLEHIDKERLARKIEEYTRTLGLLDEEIRRAEEEAARSRDAEEKRALAKTAAEYTNKRAFYAGTVPDPNELDTGLLFTIEITTLKDYNITKDKIQTVMTDYLQALSNIARDTFTAYEPAGELPDKRIQRELTAVLS